MLSISRVDSLTPALLLEALKVPPILANAPGTWYLSLDFCSLELVFVLACKLDEFWQWSWPNSGLSGQAIMIGICRSHGASGANIYRRCSAHLQTCFSSQHSAASSYYRLKLVFK